MPRLAFLSLSFALASSAATLTPTPNGLLVYDSANNVTWLADFNLPASNRFTVPPCVGAVPQPCINLSGTMQYAAAAQWVAAMNAAGYLGHTNWQLPTTPTIDKSCGKVGPNGNSFGFGCSLGALASIYNTLGFKSPNTAVTIPPAATGPFSNLQPYLYWSQTSQGSQGYSTFSFVNGFSGANTAPNFLYVLPMIPGKISGAPAGDTVYDPTADATFLANANLAASNSFGLPPCQNPTTPILCIATDGAMSWDSAAQFVANMNAASYLGQKNWELPPIDAACNGFLCSPGPANPLEDLYYSLLALPRGVPAVTPPNVATGAFHHVQPYLYWTCGGSTIAGPCSADPPVTNQEWSFSFGSGFTGTDILPNELYATAYFPGPPSAADNAAATQPLIAEVANAEAESPVIAPNTWLEIKGVNRPLRVTLASGSSPTSSTDNSRPSSTRSRSQLTASRRMSTTSAPARSTF